LLFQNKIVSSCIINELRLVKNPLHEHEYLSETKFEDILLNPT